MISPGINAQDNARRELEVKMRNLISVATKDGLKVEYVVKALAGILDSEKIIRDGQVEWL